jgi:hypothetical protein
MIKLLKTPAPPSLSAATASVVGAQPVADAEAAVDLDAEEDWGSEDFDDTEAVHATQDGRRLAEQLKKAEKKPTVRAVPDARSETAPTALVDEESLSDADNEEEEELPEVVDCPVKIHAHVQIRDLAGKKQKVPPAWKVTLTNGILKIRGHEEILFKSAEQTLGIADVDF